MPHSCVWLTTNSTVRTLGAHSLASLACVIFPYSARCSYFICDVAMSMYISCTWNSFHRIRFHFRHLPHRARYKIGWCARDNKSRNAKPTHLYCGWNHSPVRMLCGVSHRTALCCYCSRGTEFTQRIRWLFHFSCALNGTTAASEHSILSMLLSCLILYRCCW